MDIKPIAKLLVLKTQVKTLAEWPAPRLLSLSVLRQSLVAASAATIVFLVLLSLAAAILATAAPRGQKQRHADYPGNAQTQKLSATHGYISKNGIVLGIRFSYTRHLASPYTARFVTIVTVPRHPRTTEH